MHVHLLKDCLNKRITCYPWVPTKHMRGDLFNKSHSPARHMELCDMNGISMVGIAMLSPKVDMLEIFGWPEKVKEAARAKAH